MAVRIYIHKSRKTIKYKKLFLYVIVDGKIIMQDKKLITLNEHEIIERCEEIAEIADEVKSSTKSSRKIF